MTMKIFILLCFLSVNQAKEFNLGNGETISVEFRDGTTGDDEVDHDDKIISEFDEESEDTNGVDTDYTDHDCMNIRTFDVNTMDSRILNGRKFKKKFKNTFVKYNHAYGIPVIGNENFSDDSMRRSCYLIRYIFAGNEGFRRAAYKSKMYLKGQKGGFCCPPNIGRTIGCSCDILYLFTPVHEMAHFFIKYVMPIMEDKYLNIPEFKDSEIWSWAKPYNGPYGGPGDENYVSKKNPTCGNVEFQSQKFGPTYDFLWNSLQQDSRTNDPFNEDKKSTELRGCSLHHYMIYAGMENFLNMRGEGKEKLNQRREQCSIRNPNLYNLMKELWPCENTYISNCEDYAYKMTKGLGQKLLIGKLDPNNPGVMICQEETEAEIAATEIETEPLGLPGEDIAGPKQCYGNLKRGGFLVTDKNKKQVTPTDITDDVVQRLNEALSPVADKTESNEIAWWLRKCCASAAKLNQG